MNHFRGQSSSRPPLILDMLDADRSPNMQSAFLPELHRWISQLTARHLHACPQGDILITMVKETVILYKKEFREMKKSHISPWCERDENAKWLRVTVSSVQTWFYMQAYVKKSSPGSTQLPTSRHLLSPSQPLIVTSVTYIHARTRSLVAKEPPGLLWQT